MSQSPKVLKLESLSLLSDEIEIQIAEDTTELNVTIDMMARGKDVTPQYNGPYVVEPHTKNEIVLATANKKMLNNVTVLKVPYFETSNPSDGYTAYIGELE